jgi:hypothetical protein
MRIANVAITRASSAVKRVVRVGAKRDRSGLHFASKLRDRELRRVGRGDSLIDQACSTATVAAFVAPPTTSASCWSMAAKWHLGRAAMQAPRLNRYSVSAL